jgi:hypothetical protein
MARPREHETTIDGKSLQSITDAIAAELSWADISSISLEQGEPGELLAHVSFWDDGAGEVAGSYYLQTLVVKAGKVVRFLDSEGRVILEYGESDDLERREPGEYPQQLLRPAPRSRPSALAGDE